MIMRVLSHPSYAHAGEETFISILPILSTFSACSPLVNRGLSLGDRSLSQGHNAKTTRCAANFFGFESIELSLAGASVRFILHIHRGNGHIFVAAVAAHCCREDLPLGRDSRVGRARRLRLLDGA